ncbi:Uncharacterised protein [Mycolicibacterium phlei]|jgi:hemophore-related protein|uniref:Hemophore-related protein n=1 Tax=Mycolicibacterium phlei DSM 43239 = CCUG 21000 TaxID=1226750 RepID=A0A5N5VA84_MYCPH|nr:hemophore-related protein [Mycolicibacterium phlei]VEG10382.1 Uncharacterised protein [Mycobacteroides chelonae]AMO62278.1 hypothetical protein MPHLCCUG_03477 [Mycolicibacterium phlei]KAB7757389.1 hypothetical protein MPHL21000_07830 [Mycolicibacterium phlei DSM 43239 = CCUG 21000]KXW66286.1 hypothetical protein MPHL43239_08415 [Mycolicibacterium phlei DSM 43239 = CCUG 21000]KXW70328.1 hypothetical protein MPHL43072_19490 [Mycolicibacterium phlei DSM 43072]
MTHALLKTVLGAVVVAGPLAVAATASAQTPDGPLINTTCSYPQVQTALAAEAPQAADRLAQRPQAQAKLQELLALPVDERRNRVQGFLDRNPDVRGWVDERRGTPEGQRWLQTAQRVADTCGRY